MSSGIEVAEVEVVGLLVGYCRLGFVRVVMRALFHEWGNVAYVDMSVIEDFRGDGDEILYDGGD